MTHSTPKFAKREPSDIQDDENGFVSSPFEHEVLPTSPPESKFKKPKTKKGNNRYGNRGTPKCLDCRKSKDSQCIFADPDDVCERCLKRKKQCGPKQFCSDQQRLDGETPAPMLEPEEPPQELWDLSRPLLPKIFGLFTPEVTHEEILVQIVAELRDSKFDNNGMLAEALMNLFGMIHQVAPNLLDPDPEPHVSQFSPQVPVVQVSEPHYLMPPAQQQQKYVHPLTINPESLTVHEIPNNSPWPNPMAQPPSLPNPMVYVPSPMVPSRLDYSAESTNFQFNTTPGLSLNSYPNLPGIPDRTQTPSPPQWFEREMQQDPSDGTYAQFGQQPVDNFGYWPQPSMDMDWRYTNPPR